MSLPLLTLLHLNPQDPLGVAVYRTFDIGLGFRFDHMKPLREGQSPSIRRLQSRAAKSAIRRANELRELDHSVHLTNEAATELENLARRLTELVPPGYDDFEDDDEPKIEQLLRDEFTKISPNEYSVRREKVDIFQDLLRLNDAPDQSDPTKNPSGVLDEELDALNRQYGNGGARASDGSDTCLA